MNTKKSTTQMERVSVTCTKTLATMNLRVWRLCLQGVRLIFSSTRSNLVASIIALLSVLCGELPKISPASFGRRLSICANDCAICLSSRSLNRHFHCVNKKNHAPEEIGTIVNNNLAWLIISRTYMHLLANSYTHCCKLIKFFIALD
jgi:hypothetical protein